MKRLINLKTIKYGQMIKLYTNKALIVPLFYLGLISPSTITAQSIEKKSNEYFQMANDVWSWHRKENKPTVLLDPASTDAQKPIQANTLNSEVQNTTAPQQTTLDANTSSALEVNPEPASIQPIEVNSNPQQANEALQNDNISEPYLDPSLLVNGGNSEQRKFDNSPLKEDKSLSAQLPNYRMATEATKSYLKKLEETSVKFLKWQKKRPADSNLPRHSSNVAYLKTDAKFLLDNDDQQLKTVPIIDIGQEGSVSKNDFLLTQLKDLSIDYQTPNQLSTPNKISKTEIIKAKNAINKLGKLKKLKGKSWEIGPVVKTKDINNTQYTIVNNKSFMLHEVEPLSKYDVFMLSALIYKRKEYYPLALGLFDEVSKSEKHKFEASYNMGEIAHKLKLYSESAHRLLPIVLKPNEFRADAISILLKDFPKEHEKKIALALRNMENKETLPTLFMDKIYYHVSKSEFDTGKYKASRYTSGQVSKKSDLYENAQFIKGLSEYLDKDLTTAVQTLSQLQTQLEKKSKEEKNIASLVALNLGRIFFQLKKYKQSYHTYKRIHKSHPLWVQAVTELGWVQLAMGDQFGAIGNMYSMHSPYFNSIYKPETYAIKTIGYLNICQYADAYKSMTLHEKTYRDWQKKLNSFLNAGGTPSKVYQTVTKYLSGKSTQDVNGLPYQIIREIARQKDYLNTQGFINTKVDESGNYNQALSSFKVNNKKAKKQLSKYKKKLTVAKEKLNIAKNQNDSALLSTAQNNLKDAKEYVTAYYFQLRLFDHSKKKLNLLKTNTQNRIKSENRKLINLASKNLFNHLKQIHTENNNLLDNNELLRYEIYSGSGENIRFQVSGGKVKNENRIPASVKPKKALNWDFSGEFWEDEIGNYRTTLVDKCPK